MFAVKSNNPKVTALMNVLPGQGAALLLWVARLISGEAQAVKDELLGEIAKLEKKKNPDEGRQKKIDDLMKYAAGVPLDAPAIYRCLGERSEVCHGLISC
jgi:hypothetical protein